MITVECEEAALDTASVIRVGKLNLVDLAGSEKQSKTGAEVIFLRNLQLFVYCQSTNRLIYVLQFSSGREATRGIKHKPLPLSAGERDFGTSRESQSQRKRDAHPIQRQ
jgi:hypothetical protein